MFHSIRFGAKYWALVFWFVLSSGFAQTPSKFLNTPASGLTQSNSSENDPAPSRVPPEIAKPLNDIHVDVNGYEIIGAPKGSEAEIQKRLKPFTGKNKTFEDLADAARVVSAYLQTDLGLYLAYAYLPAQTITNGTIKINVLPGVLEKVQINWPEKPLRVKREIIEKHLARLKPGTVIHVSEVERVVFLINDLRGIKVSFAVKPGDKPGTAILVASPVSTKAVKGKLTVDSNGSRFAGVYRAAVTLNWDSPFGIGDSLSLSHLSSDTGGLKYTLLGYTAPVGSNGFKVGLNASQVDYSLSENDFPLGLNGDSHSYGGFVLYPLKRSRNFNLFSLVSMDQAYYTDRQALTASETSKGVTTYKASLSGDFRDAFFGGSINFFDFGIERSLIHYDGAVPAGLDDASQSKKFTFSMSRLQALVKNELLLWSNLRGQWARNNLDSTNQCSLGGASGVRAFAQGEGSGDNCMLLTLEARHPLSGQWLGSLSRQMSLNLFYDVGRTRFRYDASARPATFKNYSILAGYGLGLVWDRPDRFNFNLDLAFEDRGIKRSDTKSLSPRVYASFTTRF